MMPHVESSSITAAQIGESCPAKLTELGQRIAAHLDKAERCDQKANDHRIAAGQLLAQAKEICDEGGFTAFRERFCPHLGKTRAHELAAIATGKKTIEQSRAENAARNRKHRANRKAVHAAVHHVTEAAVIQCKRPAAKPMSADEFMDRASTQLAVLGMTLADMAKSDLAGARRCADEIHAQLHAAINDSTRE